MDYTTTTKTDPKAKCAAENAAALREARAMADEIAEEAKAERAKADWAKRGVILPDSWAKAMAVGRFSPPSVSGASTRKA